jgi:hypothetical protein
MGEVLDDQVLSLQMSSALTLDPCQVPFSFIASVAKPEAK